MDKQNDNIKRGLNTHPTVIETEPLTSLSRVVEEFSADSEISLMQKALSSGSL